MTVDETLEIFASRIDMHHDEPDANAVNFRHADGYLSMQIRTHVDPDDSPEENEPHLEMRDDSTGQCIHAKRVRLDKNAIFIELAEAFCSRCHDISICLPHAPDSGLADFFVNHLFPGQCVAYGDGIPDSLHIRQTRFGNFP